MTDCTKRKTCNKIVGNPYEWQNPCPCRDYEQEMDKYKWRDLRKDPENLPEEWKNVYVYFEYFRYGDHNCMCKDYGISYQVDGIFHFVNGSSGWRKLKIIAWREIEPFEEE